MAKGAPKRAVKLSRLEVLLLLGLGVPPLLPLILIPGNFVIQICTHTYVYMYIICIRDKA